MLIRLAFEYDLYSRPILCLTSPCIVCTVMPYDTYVCGDVCKMLCLCLLCRKALKAQVSRLETLAGLDYAVIGRHANSVIFC